MASSKLVAKTAKTNIFDHPTRILKKKTNKLKFKNTKIEIPDSLYNKEIVNKVNMHYPIRFSTWTKIKLLFIPKCLKTDRNKQLTKVFDEGKVKIENSLE